MDIAEKHDIPTVLDPVAAGAGKFRQQVALDLIEHHRMSLLRGNAGEIAALIGERVASKGVDSAQVDDVGKLALRANQILQLPIVITGETDAIAVNEKVLLLHNGSSLMPLVTGTGCLLGAVLAAFIGLAKEKDLLACLEEALSAYNIAGELAEKKLSEPLPGSFQIAFLDALHQVTNTDIERLKKLRSIMDKEILQVYFICGTANCPEGKFLEILEAAFKSGVTCFQFREKGANALKGDEKVVLARKVKELCRKYQIPLIINDDVDLALELDADGIHLGQDDLPITKARQLFPNKIIGLSVGSTIEYQQSAVGLVDYIGVGPIFPTSSKNDAGEVIGLKGLNDVRDYDKEIPIVAIGGITFGDVAAIKQSGADGVAVISAIAQSKQVEVDTQRLSSCFD